MRSLTEHLVDLLQRPVGEVDRRRAASHLRDWIACAVLGATSEAGRLFATYGQSQSAGPCNAIGAGKRTAETAAFVNGGLGNVYELDDTHRLAILHPGDTVIPAALAIAEREACDGAALLDAIVRGYEATIRVGIAAGSGHYRHWYSSATCGVFGAAAAAASILQLDRPATAQALAGAGMQAAGVWQCRMEPGHAKQLATARAAQAGVMAADFARLGFRGPLQILEGEHGLFVATGADGARSALADAADAPWKIWETSFKPWPACRVTHPVIEAVLALRDKLEPISIASIQIETFRQAIEMCDNPLPRTPHAGRFSLQHCAAIALLCGAPKLAHFEPEWLDRSDVAALRAKILVQEKPALTEAFPGRLGASISVSRVDGSSLHLDLRTAKGDPENPMTEAELEHKAWDLLGVVGLRGAMIDRLLAAAADVGHQRSTARLSSALADLGSDDHSLNLARAG